MDQAAYFAQMRRKRRNDILDMAKALILDQGIASFQMQQLAREMDISGVTLYKYFKNSEDVVLELKERMMEERIIKKKQEAFEAGESDSGILTREKILSLFRGGFAQMKDCREDITILAVLEGYLRKCSGYVKPQDYVLYLTGRSCGEFVQMIGEGQEAEKTVRMMTNMCAALMRQVGLMSKEEFSQYLAETDEQIRLVLTVFEQALFHGHL